MQTLRQDMETRFTTCMKAIQDLTTELRTELETANTERRAHEDMAQRIKELHEKFISGEMEDLTNIPGWDDMVQEFRAGSSQGQAMELDLETLFILFFSSSFIYIYILYGYLVIGMGL
jgi:hypothetical protein